MVARTAMIHGLSGQLLDPRVTAYRESDGLAAKRLQGVVDAREFRKGSPYEVIGPWLKIYHAPSPNAECISLAITGDRVRLYDVGDGWAWIQVEHDSHVGYVRIDNNDLSPNLSTPTHEVCVPYALILKGPDVEYGDDGLAYGLGARVSLIDEDGKFVRTDHGGWIRRDELGPPGQFAAVGHAWTAPGRELVGRPYRWAGTCSAWGVDCSGLIYRLRRLAGHYCPRDTDQMEAYFNEERAKSLPTEGLERRLMVGDLVFWPGHMGVMLNGADILHACPWRRRVMLENLVQLEELQRQVKNREISSIKRLID